MKSKNCMKAVGIILLCGLMTGCATLITGTTQELTFISNPDGATVAINGKVIGKTPITTSLKKVSGQSLIFSKDGYKQLSMGLDTRMNGWFWGNIPLFYLGLFGSTTDGISGAINEYSPSQYMVTLQSIDSTQLDSKTSLTAKQKAKDFIVVGYKQILGDLRKGDGQYLASLLQLLNVPPEGKHEAIGKISGLATAYNNIPEFADRVVDIYLK